LLKNISKDLLLTVFLSLVFALVPVGLAQAATALPVGTQISTGNVAGKPSVTVSGLTVGMIVKVYDASSGGKLLGSATVKTGTSVIVSLSSLKDPLFVSVTMESDRQSIEVSKTDTLLPAEVGVINNAGIADTVTVTGVTGLLEGDVVKVYDTNDASAKLLGTSKVLQDKAVVSIKQLPDPSSGGVVFVTLTKSGKTESSRFGKDYSGEPQTAALVTRNITIKNNAGVADTVTVTGLTAGDIIKVYGANDLSAKPLGTATVAKEKTEAVVSIKQLGTGVGLAYVTVTSIGERESDPLASSYDIEPKTVISWVTDQIVVVNNSGTADTVTVTGLVAGDIVKVYKGTILLSTSVVKVNSAVVSISQLGTGSGTVNVSVTRKEMQESALEPVDYDAEVQSSPPVDADITVVNNVQASSDDTVTVTGLVAGDIIKVYKTSAGGLLWGKATVASGSTEAKLTIRQLGTGAGSVWVTVTSAGKLESTRIEQSYLVES